MTDAGHRKWARKILVFLVQRIQNFEGGDESISYGSLARRVEYPRPHTGLVFSGNISKTLGVMWRMMDGLEIDGQRVPMIQSLVVNRKEKLPGNGLKAIDERYPELSREEKRALVQSEYRKIFAFGAGWAKVLARVSCEDEY